MIDFDEACRLTADIAEPLGVKPLPLAAAAGRRLAEPVVARRTAPGADTSAMDGYAVRAADLQAGATRLRVVGETFAGGAALQHTLEPGDCVRVFTGAPLPAGADQVVIQEDVLRDGDVAVLARAPGPARHVRQAGSDFAKARRCWRPARGSRPRLWSRPRRLISPSFRSTPNRASRS